MSKPKVRRINITGEKMYRKVGKKYYLGKYSKKDGFVEERLIDVSEISNYPKYTSKTKNINRATINYRYREFNEQRIAKTRTPAPVRVMEPVAEPQDKHLSKGWVNKYRKYLRTQKWKDLRQKVIIRDKNTCQDCKKAKATQVHHVSYELYNEEGHSIASELTSLCYSCHQSRHNHMNLKH